MAATLHNAARGRSYEILHGQQDRCFTLKQLGPKSRQNTPANCRF